MKVAFDENIPDVMVTVFQTLAAKERILNASIVTASDYKPKSERGDEHWVKRFAQDDGRVIISGDTKMHGRIHELAALTEAGLVTYFFERHWSNFQFFTKSAMLLHWWTTIRKHMDTADKRTCWEIPCQWTIKDLRNVTVDPKAITQNRQGKEQ